MVILMALHNAHQQLELGQLALRLMMIERLSQDNFADAIALGETLLEVTTGEIRQEGMSELVILYLHTGQTAQAQTLFASFKTEYPDDLTVHELLQEMLDGVTNKNFAGQAAKSNLARDVDPQTLAAATETPLTFAVEQNYPNPFNPTTTISYQLPEPGSVRIRIFNLMGQEVNTLYDGHNSSGTHSVVWGGEDNSGRQISSGTYIYRITFRPTAVGSNEFTKTRKLVLVR